jgi:hypothetical protein
VLKQKVSYDIVRRLHDLEDNSSLAQQRGILFRAAVLCTMRLCSFVISPVHYLALYVYLISLFVAHLACTCAKGLF